MNRPVVFITVFATQHSHGEEVDFAWLRHCDDPYGMSHFVGPCAYSLAHNAALELNKPFRTKFVILLKEVTHA